VPSLKNLIPALSLKGISTSAMPAALAPWVGPNAAGLSPASIVRLVAGWQDEYPAWSKRDLRQEEIVCRRAQWDLRQRTTARHAAVPVGRQRRAQGWEESLARDQRRRAGKLAVTPPGSDPLKIQFPISPRPKIGFWP